MMSLNISQERFWRQKYSSVKIWLVSGAIWMVVGTFFGLFSAIHLVAPDFFANIPWLEFGRVRPVHTNTVLFGFATSMTIGVGLYSLPRVLDGELFSEPMANLAALLFGLGILAGNIWLLFGYTQSHEYAEYIFPADVLIIIAFLLLTVNFTMTMIRRREPIVYVSVWYLVGGAIWSTGIYFVGNVMWHPLTGAQVGITDAITVWCYGHTIFGLLATPFALAIVYYMLPRVAEAPLYSQWLGIIGFWTLLAFYGHIGGHHLLQAPVPTWFKTMSIIDSFAMVLPVATVLVNFWYTARGKFGRFINEPAPRLLFFGTIWYAIVCLQGPIQSLAWVQRVTHLNNWVVGHSHIAVLGFVGFIALGGMYYILPKVTGQEIYSKKLVIAQFWLVLLGLLGFFAFLTAAGLIQGQCWLNGETVYRTVPTLKPYMVLRLVSGLLVITGAVVGLYNVLMSLGGKKNGKAEVS